MSFYEVSKVRQNIWAIHDMGLVTLFVIEGDEKALLIDTGHGLGNLKDVVKSLTNLPLIIVNTHAHPDHCCGNHLFDEVHIAQTDMNLLNEFYDREFRTEYANFLEQRYSIDEETLQKWIYATLPTLRGIKEGHVFQLGHLDVEVMAIPGHTPGCLAFLVRQERILFTGDMVLTTPIWLHLDNALPLERYLASLHVLKKNSQRFDCLLTSHGEMMIENEMIDKLISCTEQALAQTNRGDIVHTPFGDGIQYAYENVSILGRVEPL